MTQSCSSNKDGILQAIRTGLHKPRSVYVGFLLRGVPPEIRSEKFYRHYNGKKPLYNEVRIRQYVTVNCLDSSNIYSCVNGRVQELLSRLTDDMIDTLKTEADAYSIIVHRYGVTYYDPKRLMITFVDVVRHQGFLDLVTRTRTDYHKDSYKFYDVYLRGDGIPYAENVFDDTERMYLNSDDIANLPRWFITSNIKGDPDSDPIFQARMSDFGAIHDDKVKHFLYMENYNLAKYVIQPVAKKYNRQRKILSIIA